MTVVKEEHPELARPLDAEDAGEAGAGSASSDEENDVDDEDQEETDTDSDGENRNVGDAPAMKKGPWTPEEDKRLKEYVEAHGEGNWNRLQRNAGLNRCGKSCRLRWANHLRPDLKKGPFEEDEIDKILEFHMKWGNKWAKMASKVHRIRIDNEIKNFWNTRLKRHHKAGMPIYPEHLVSRVTDQNMSWHTPDERHGKKRPNESSHEKVIGMHDLIDEVMTFQHLDYGKDPVVPTKPLKRHASTGNLKNFYSIDLNNVSTSAIASGYPVHGYSGTTMKTELPSFQSLELPLLHNSELPYFQSKELPSIQNYALGSDGPISSQTTGLLGASILNGGILEPVKPEIFEVPVPYAHNAVSSNAYCMSQVFDDTEIQASNSSSCMLDASLEASLLTTSLQASLLNTSLQVSLLNDDALHLRNLFNEDDDPLPLENLYQPFDSSASKTDEANHDSTAWKTDGGQSFDSSAWKSIASDYHKFDFPSPYSPGSENNE